MLQTSSDAFAQQLTGTVIRPDSDDYDEARKVWNGMIDRRPAMIVRCQNVQDVVASVNFARDNDLLLAVRGGAHNVAGNATCDGGLVLDLGPMKEIKRSIRSSGSLVLKPVAPGLSSTSRRMPLDSRPPVDWSPAQALLASRWEAVLAGSCASMA